MKNIHFKLTVLGLLLAILGAGAWSGYQLLSPKPLETTELKAQFLKGGEFSLTMSDRHFQLSELKGNVVVLYFGYTFCPDVCPTGLAVIREAFSKLGEELSYSRGVFVSLDPERDGADRLTEYASYFHERIIGMTGTAPELDLITKNYGVFYRKVAMADSALGYAVDHSANYFVIDKEGQLAYVLDHSVDSDILANTIKRLH